VNDHFLCIPKTQKSEGIHCFRSSLAWLFICDFLHAVMHSEGRVLQVDAYRRIHIHLSTYFTSETTGQMLMKFGVWSVLILVCMGPI